MKPGPQLVYSSRTGRLDQVEDVLRSSNVDIDFRNRDANTALIYAARHGYLQIVRRLLECKANCNIQGEENNTALIWAARNVRVDIVQTLLESRASSNLSGQNDRTALMWAQNVKCSSCVSRNHTIMKMLKKHQTDELRRVFSGRSWMCADILEVVISFLV